MVVFPKIGTNRLLTLRPFQWDNLPSNIGDEKPKDNKEVRYVIMGVKDNMPDLYYFHSDRMTGSDEQSDTFGKVWVVSPPSAKKRKWIFPLIKWDIPSAIGERVTFGVGFTGEFP